MYQTDLTAADVPPTVVVHCSDPRYQPHFQEFLRTHLALTKYALLAVPGGPQLFTLEDASANVAGAGWRWTTFLVDLMTPARLILIAHDDCRWYIENQFVQDAAHARERMIADMRQAKGELMTRYGGVAVDLFYARLSDGTCTFERL